MSIAPADSILKDLLTAVGPRSRRVMKRCFMTGKQCIFSSQVAEAAIKSMAETGSDLTVFVIMPFGPNLETFYRWSLKPFLTQGYGINEWNIRRADEVRDIGYIICEKVCHRIQDTDLALADISLFNENVFYEIGLAYGLERPIVFLQHQTHNQRVMEDPIVKQSLDMTGVGDERPLDYPGVGMLVPSRIDHQLHRFVKRPRRPEPSNRRLKISVLSVVRAQGGQATPAIGDIPLGLEEVLDGAIGVAMSEIKRESESSEDPWCKVMRNIGMEDWNKFKTPEKIEVDGRGGFGEIVKKIESSFCTIIDVSSNDPIAYFWLGYCHARGLNGIPVYRVGEMGKTEEKNAAPSREMTTHKQAALAFDIRALWYAEFFEKEPYRFKDKLREILQHLLEHDLPNRQKRAFWDRFPAEKKLRILTGTIHNPQLNREMVGDWDVRAVSELFSNLLPVREALAIELATPLYSPEEAYKRFARSRVGSDEQRSGPDKRREFIEHFRNGIENQLRDCNAIVIASPDVNPVTEYLRHAIYQVKTPTKAFEDCNKPDFEGYVVMKRLKRESSSSHPDTISAVSEESHGSGLTTEHFPRLFYCEEENPRDRPDRGFVRHAATKSLDIEPDLLKPYLSQDQCEEPFELLGHLVVARYPVLDPKARTSWCY